MNVLMASLDLSSAFDVVNVELLMKRLEIVGLPNDILKLISTWLGCRHFYVSIKGEKFFNIFWFSFYFFKANIFHLRQHIKNDL